MKQTNAFARDIITLSSVPLISQAMSIALMPIVTRLYAPEAFGLQSLFGSIVTLIGVFSTLSYHNSLILPKYDDEAFNMFIICIILIVVISGCSVLIIFFGYDFIIQKSQTPELKYYLWLTPFFVFLHGLYQTLRFWNTRLKHFGKIAAARVIETGCNKGFVLGAGSLGHTTGGSLIYSALFASILKSLVLVGKLWQENKKQIKHITTIEKLLAGAKRYRKFPMYSVWNELLSRIPSMLMVFLTIHYFNKTLLGHYSLALIVLSMPSVLLTSSIIEAFSPRAAMLKHEGKHVDLLLKVNEKIVSLTIFPFMVLSITGDILFKFIFGANWAEAGTIVQILVIRSFFEIIFTPAMSFINILEKQEVSSFRRIANIAVVVVSLVVGGIYNNFYLAILMLSLLQGMVTGATGLYIMHIIKFPLRTLINKLFFYFCVCISMGIILTTVRLWIDYSTLIILAIIGVSAVIYYTLLFYYDKELRTTIFDVIKGFTRIAK
jgi:O-antigen/teichoic acid export membrane protein